MSAPRIVLSVGVLLAALVGASWYATTAFPIVAAVQGEALRQEEVAAQAVTTSMLNAPESGAVAGRSDTGRAVLLLDQRSGAVLLLDQRSGGTSPPPQQAPHSVTPENPIPRRTRGVSPAWPSAYAGREMQVVVTARITIDRNGSVTSVARDRCSVTTVADQDETVCRAFFEASATAIRQWRYDRPVQAPLQFSVAIRFRPGAEPEIAQSMDIAMEGWLRDGRENQEALRNLALARARIDQLNAMSREVERAARLVVEQQRASQDSDLRRLQEKLAQLSAEVGMAQAQLDLAARAAPIADERARLQEAHETVRQLAERVESQKRAVALQSGGNASSSFTVNPTPTTAFDGSPRLVSPSGRAPVRVGGTVRDKMPVPTKQVQPVYTAELMRARIQGTVAVEVLVDETGKVADARVLRSVPLLDDAALAAAKQWEFTPTLLNGEPVPVLLMLELHFRLR